MRAVPHLIELLFQGSVAPVDDAVDAVSMEPSERGATFLLELPVADPREM